MDFGVVTAMVNQCALQVTNANQDPSPFVEECKLDANPKWVCRS